MYVIPKNLIWRGSEVGLVGHGWYDIDPTNKYPSGTNLKENSRSKYKRKKKNKSKFFEVSNVVKKRASRDDRISNQVVSEKKF